ncbi:MAG TPA: hypothetical protein VLF89_01365 [Candidatus Saccharimonadales bacterium]|nr:hypothetical protein [Candidatus Saccharimonadales bacterium]
MSNFFETNAKPFSEENIDRRLPGVRMAYIQSMQTVAEAFSPVNPDARYIRPPLLIHENQATHSALIDAIAPELKGSPMQYEVSGHVIHTSRDILQEFVDKGEPGINALKGFFAEAFTHAQSTQPVGIDFTRVGFLMMKGRRAPYKENIIAGKIHKFNPPEEGVQELTTLTSPEKNPQDTQQTENVTRLTVNLLMGQLVSEYRNHQYIFITNKESTYQTTLEIDPDVLQACCKALFTGNDSVLQGVLDNDLCNALQREHLGMAISLTKERANRFAYDLFKE